MVALAVPTRFRHLVAHRGDDIDVGRTMLRVLENIDKDEWAIELGGQSYALSHEVHLAREEETTLASAWPSATSAPA